MMIFPVVQRELAVAARSRRVFRWRLLPALGSTALALLTLLNWNLTGRGRASVAGDGLFGFLSGLFWLVCLGSGIFLTADCLSREKREGTLGLLFLTDLKGYDVVLGKLASSSLTTAMMLLGVMPVLAICVLLGGVSGAELFRVCLALVLTMLFSLSMGMLVSTFVRESSQAGSATFLFLMLATIGIPTLSGLAKLLPGNLGASLDFLDLFNPAYLVRAARSPAGIGTRFFESVTGLLLVSVALLAISSFCVRYTWQDRSRRRTRVEPAITPRKSAGLIPSRSRNPLLDRNPILWLAGGHVRKGWIAAVIAAVLAIVGMSEFPDESKTVTPLLLSYVIPHLVALSIASQGAQFFVRMRQQNALEFLLSTPLSDREILRGQWQALRRLYLPVVLVLFALIWMPFYSYRGLPGFTDFHNDGAAEWAARFYVSLKAALVLFAAGWAGMYFGLHAHRTQFAGLLAMTCAVFLPWFLACVPEVIPSMIVLTFFKAGTEDEIRRSIMKKLESGQLI